MLTKAEEHAIGYSGTRNLLCSLLLKAKWCWSIDPELSDRFEDSGSGSHR